MFIVPGEQTDAAEEEQESESEEEEPVEEESEDEEETQEDEEIVEESEEEEVANVIAETSLENLADTEPSSGPDSSPEEIAGEVTAFLFIPLTSSKIDYFFFFEEKFKQIGAATKGEEEDKELTKVEISDISEDGIATISFSRPISFPDDFME